MWHHCYQHLVKGPAPCREVPTCMMHTMATCDANTQGTHVTCGMWQGAVRRMCPCTCHHSSTQGLAGGTWAQTWMHQGPKRHTYIKYTPQCCQDHTTAGDAWPYGPDLPSCTDCVTQSCTHSYREAGMLALCTTHACTCGSTAANASHV